MTGGFTGAGSIPVVERPMLAGLPKGVPDKLRRRKRVREAALRVVGRLLGEAACP